jgi:hypothetical protein
MLNKTDSVKTFCSKEQLEKQLGKTHVWNLTFLERTITGKLVEVGGDFVIIELRDNRRIVARADTILGFGETKSQPLEV